MGCSKCDDSLYIDHRTIHPHWHCQCPGPACRNWQHNFTTVCHVNRSSFSDQVHKTSTDSRGEWTPCGMMAPPTSEMFIPKLIHRDCTKTYCVRCRELEQQYASYMDPTLPSKLTLERNKLEEERATVAFGFYWVERRACPDLSHTTMEDLRILARGITTTERAQWQHLRRTNPDLFFELTTYADA